MYNDYYTYVSFKMFFLNKFQALFGSNPTISIICFTCTLLFNGAMSAGSMANILDVAPNFSGTITGIINTFSSIGGWLSAILVAILTEESQTFDQWRHVFWMLGGLYALGAVFFVVFATAETEKWNSVEVGEGETKKFLARHESLEIRVSAKNSRAVA